MDNDIIDDEHRRLDEPPVEIDIVAQRAGAPAKVAINDLGLSNINAECARMKPYAQHKFIFRHTNIPFAQSLDSLLRLLCRNQESQVKLNPIQPVLNYFNAILPAQIVRIPRLPILSRADAAEVDTFEGD